MKITRRFSRPGSSVYDQFEYTRRSSVLRNPDGSTVFELRDIEVPKAWSQVATDILAQKYFRKAGIPQFDASGNPMLDENGAPVLGAEKSIRQVVHRLVGCWTQWGKLNSYFDTDDDAQAFYDEVAYTLLNQMTAPNSPQWFNTGLNFAYGIEGPAQGHYYVDPATGKLARSKDAYSRPTPHACFIQSVGDDLVNDGGIFDLITREARIFKYGSGTGSNFSALRAGGEPLSGGGVSSGLMSFLKVADRAAGAVKSGGTTRRAAKMVILNADHPDIEQFIDWKMIEEQKVAALVAGSKTCNLFLNEIMAVAAEDGIDYSNPESRLHELVQKALNRGIPLNYIVRALTLVEQGQTSIDFATYTTHYEGDAYLTVSGQNSNNSIRVTSDFMKGVENDGDWNLIRRTDGTVVRTIKARSLWHRINYAAWSSADPGLQYHSTINEWHTCPKDGEINASNPCVTGDTLVATSEGYRRIIDLVGKSAVVYGNDRELHEVDRIFPTGRKAVYELETKAGYKLRLTADHKVWTINRGDVPASELTTGDTVMLQGADFGNKWIDSNIAEAIGLALGDGCVNKVNQVVISFCREDRDLAERISTTFNGIKPDRFGSVQEKGTTIQVGSSAFEVRMAIMPFAHLDRGSEGKAFTDEIHSLCRNSVAAVLRGLFTADGTVANYGEKSQYISLDSCSLELLEQTQLLLLSFGIKSKIYRNRRSAGSNVGLLPDGKGGMAEYPVQQMHSLRISKASRIVFEKEIGFCEGSAKNERLRLMNETVTTYSDKLVDPVASVTLIGEEDVYDLTEPETHHFVANGIAVHNCSEYMFLDDTACNLASINLAHFFDSTTGVFDAEGYKHACRIWTVVLEISVLMAQFPSKEIAQRSYEFRTLGLGYANLGTVLMTAGIPYDSEEGRSWAGAITAIMTGESYAASAEMAGELGAFPGYKRNAKNMLRVIRNHRRAAYSAPDSEYEGLTIKPVGLDPSLCPENVLAAARECWDRALALGEKNGYRNAQTSVLAPTGTIGLIMDCDTTGVEPDFAIVKFKKLSGGGYFKIVNQSVPKALARLGYSETEIGEIERYIKGHGTLLGCPHINRASLRELKLTDEKIDAVEAQLDTVFDIRFAFNKWTLGEDFLKGLGFTAEQLDDPGFDILTAFGFNGEQIEEANRFICGTMTIEGAPGLKAEHLPIFDCANKCGKYGTRYIDYMGHVKMMAAAQPFITGAISKTINMPNHATVEEVDKVYMESWKLMVKAIALYRDGSKLSQPLNSTHDSTLVEEVTISDMIGEENDFNEMVGAAEIHEVRERIIEKVYHRAERRRLPKRRHGFVREATVGGHKVFIRTGEYEDGTLGEIFIDMYKEGASFKGLLNCFAVLASKALQYGMPLEKIVDTFTFTRFEPSGPVYGHEAIKNATSIIDYVFRAIGYEYLGRQDFVHIKAVDETEGTNFPGNGGGNGNGSGNGRPRVSPGQDLWASRQTLTDTPSATARAGAGEERKVATARAQGFTGDQCGNCGSMRVKQNGACHVCEDCGTTSGCS